MRMKALHSAAFVVAVVVASVAVRGMRAEQATVSGTWSGTPVFKGADPGEEPIHLVITQDGTTLTGTAGPDADHQYRITKAKLTNAGSAASVTFDLILNAVLTSFDLKLTDGALKGEATTEGEDGHKRVAAVELKKG